MEKAEVVRWLRELGDELKALAPFLEGHEVAKKAEAMITAADMLEAASDIGDKGTAAMQHVVDRLDAMSPEEYDKLYDKAARAGEPEERIVIAPDVEALIARLEKHFGYKIFPSTVAIIREWAGGKV